MSTTTVDRGYAAFELEYDGPALQAHEMDIRALAPALLSVADLFHDLNRLVHPADPPVSVNVRATSEGSFLVELRILYEIAKHALTLPDVDAVANLRELVGAAGSVITFLRARRGQPHRVEDVEPGLARVTFADETTLEVPRTVLDASQQASIRRSVADLVQPLHGEGVDSLRIRHEQIVIATVEKGDIPAFEQVPPIPRQVLATREREVFLTILTAGFESRRWRFYDGQATLTARITDPDFLARVDAGESFSKLDVLRCLVREQQWRDDKGLHQEIELVRVIEHLPPAQGQLDLSSPA